MKKRVKALLGRLGFAAGLHRRLLRDHAVVIAFHRISDAEAGSALNCREEVFAELCRFFRRHFSVKPLQELIRRLNENEPVGGILCITFDDGYKDNFDVAAPILKELGLPATFFVATNFIGSETVPPWDRKDGYPSEWMGWQDVADLVEMGFDIGGHTMNHADLGRVDGATARTEIAGCRDALTGRLAIDVPNFAYPFGGPANITPDAARIVAEEGFCCCLSCHGGIVSGRDDPFALAREPINEWVESAYQYGFELLTKANGARA